MRCLAPFLLLALAACSPRPPLAPPPPPLERPAPSAQVPAPPSADLLRVEKAARRLKVWSGRRLLRTFTGIQLGRAPVGAKRFEGDGRTPEGRYAIDWRNPRSAFHLSLHVSYPDARDLARARAAGRSAGGLIMIHGQPNGSTRRMAGDWTDGCIALSDAEIEELWGMVPDGAAVEIVP